jgi:hypothetical protein
MELIKYVRDRKGRPFACVAAVDKDKVGYSICHTKDRFNKELGRSIAIERAKKFPRNTFDRVFAENPERTIGRTRFPSKYKLHEVIKEMKSMLERSRKYFKEQ